LEKVAAGDRQAFAELYRQASPKLFAIALRMVRASDTAEEILQEAFLLIWRKADRYRPERGEAFAWMVAIVRNCAIDIIRSRTRTTALIVDVEEVPEPVHVVDADELWAMTRVGDKMRGCLQALQKEQRICIYLAYYYGKSHEEIAAAVQRPLGSVKSWVRRGLLKLKDCLEQ
jgi:RNA polymerase sigma-70 factor (ECF subfamily)